MTTAAYQQIISAPSRDRLDLFLATANRLGTPIGNVEKDFWVYWTLNALYLYRIAFRISRKSTLRRRPVLPHGGIKGSIRTHSSSVRPVGYSFVFRSILAIRLRVAWVHIPSLNHATPKASSVFKRSLTRKAMAVIQKRLPDRANSLTRPPPPSQPWLTCQCFEDNFGRLMTNSVTACFDKTCSPRFTLSNRLAAAAFLPIAKFVG
jgi:hypothetical protein